MKRRSLFPVLVMGALLLAGCKGASGSQNQYVLKDSHQVRGRQGVCVEGDYYWVSGSTTLTKYDKSWNVVYENTKEGRTYVVKYPLGESGKRAMKQVFSLGSLDVAVAYLYADNALLTTQDTFMSARGMLERLLDGDLLNEKMEHLFRDRLRVLLPNAVVEFGRNGYLRGIDQLLEAGVLNEGNVETALDAAMEAGEIAVLSRLMEIRRTHFGTPLFDFDL